MTPRDYLLRATPRDPQPLGLRGVAAVLGAVEQRGVALPGIDAPHATAADARAALPHVLRAALDALAALEGDARAAHQASGHGHRDVAALHRTAAETLRALHFELHAAARVALVPIASQETTP